MTTFRVLAPACDSRLCIIVSDNQVVDSQAELLYRDQTVEENKPKFDPRIVVLKDPVEGPFRADDMHTTPTLTESKSVAVPLTSPSDKIILRLPKDVPRETRHRVAESEDHEVRSH